MHDRRPAIRWRAQSGRAGIDRPATVARAGPQALPRGAASPPGAHPRRGVLARRVGSVTYQVSADGDKFATVVTTVETRPDQSGSKRITPSTALRRGLVT